jgi:hypothetical protein
MVVRTAGRSGDDRPRRASLSGVEPAADNLPPPTVRTAIERAIASCEGLGLLGEDVEDEWQYVQDLGAAWLTRLESTAATRGDESLAPEVGAAVDRACAEAALIRDPHRAIDWLSTLPQVVLVALGERP